MLSNDDVLLLRIVNPKWVQEDFITSLVFTPSRGRPISVFDGSMISSQEALERFVNDGYAAYGVVGLTVGEVRSLGLDVIEDRVPYPEHISLSYPDCSRNEVKRISRALRDLAQRRGWLYKS